MLLLLEKHKITSTFSFVNCGSNISTENGTFNKDKRGFQYIQNNRLFSSEVIVFYIQNSSMLYPKQQYSNIKINSSVHLHQKLRFVFIEKNTMLTSKITGYLLHVPFIGKT